MKTMSHILYLCILIFTLTACQPVASDPSGTPEESSAQRAEISATDPQEESSPAGEIAREETSSEEETPLEETEPVEEPTGYPEGEIQAELIFAGGSLYVLDRYSFYDGILPEGAVKTGEIRSVVNTEEPDENYEASHVEVGSSIYFAYDELQYRYVQRPGKDRYERFVRIAEDRKWWSEEKPVVVECVLEPIEDTYVMYPDQFVKEGDRYIISGKKCQAGGLHMTWEQKAFLDAGAVMNIFYEGKWISQVSAYMRTTGSPEIRYSFLEIFNNKVVNVSGGWLAKIEITNDRPGREWLAKAPFYGCAFTFVFDSARGYNPLLDPEYQITLSGDVLIDTLHGSQQGETLTLDAFYEKRILSEGGQIQPLLNVRVENGEVVRIKEAYVP